MPAVAIARDNDACARIWPRERLGPDLFADFRRAIEGARFVAARKINVVPFDRLAPIVTRLRQSGFSVRLGPGVQEELARFDALMWADKQGARDRVAALDKELRGRGESLRDYQIKGIEWLIGRKGAVLADEQGLGKTLQTLATIPANTPTIVVCPASVKGVWSRETKRWRPQLRVTILEGRESFRWPEDGEIVITNFDVLPPVHADGCKALDCDGCAPIPGCPDGCILVVDEAHKIKNPKAQRTRSCRYLGVEARRKSGRVFVLTGTPLQNRPEELWNVFRAADVALEAFGSWSGFVDCFQGSKEAIYTKSKKTGKRVVRHVMKWGSPTEEAVDRIRRVFLRRTKADVARDLPPKSWTFVPVAIDEQALRACDEALSQIGGLGGLEKLLDKGGKIGFEEISEARSMLCQAKVPAMLEAIEPYEEAGNPLLVFAWHRAPIDLLAERDGWAVITGSTPSREREAIVEAFQAGELKGLGATIQAAGTGLTLTRSSNVLFVDRSWNPADNAQAEDRVHRISQENPVSITVLVAEHPLDERVQEVLSGKQTLIDQSVERAREGASVG